MSQTKKVTLSAGVKVFKEGMAKYELSRAESDIIRYAKEQVALNEQAIKDAKQNKKDNESAYKGILSGQAIQEIISAGERGDLTALKEFKLPGNSKGAAFADKFCDAMFAAEDNFNTLQEKYDVIIEDATYAKKRYQSIIDLVGDIELDIEEQD